ncbi:MAG: hypothetical protein SGARI_000401 [Bacillariaceae sp.]
MGPLGTRWISGGAIDDKDTADLLEPENTTVGLPFREFGYRTKPFTWEELHQIIVIDKDLARLSRSVDEERRYKQEREARLKEYVTIYDHILHSVFQFERKRDAASGKWKAVPPPTDDNRLKSNYTTLVKNDYPYFIESDIEHWVLWKLQSEISEEDVIAAIEELKARNGGGNLDVIWWENPPSLKSLPDINHIHILATSNNRTSST